MIRWCPPAITVTIVTGRSACKRASSVQRVMHAVTMRPGLWPHYLCFPVHVQDPDCQRAKPVPRLLHFNPESACLNILYKGKSLQCINLSQIARLSYDEAHPCTAQVHKQSSGPLSMTFGCREDSCLFRTAFAAVALGRFQASKFTSTQLIEGDVWVKKGITGWIARHAVLVAQRLMLFDGPTSAYPRDVLSVSTGTRNKQDQLALHRPGGGQVLLRFADKSQLQACCQYLPGGARHGELGQSLQQLMHTPHQSSIPLMPVPPSNTSDRAAATPTHSCVSRQRLQGCAAPVQGATPASAASPSHGSAHNMRARGRSLSFSHQLASPGGSTHHLTSVDDIAQQQRSDVQQLSPAGAQGLSSADELQHVQGLSSAHELQHVQGLSSADELQHAQAVLQALQQQLLELSACSQGKTEAAHCVPTVSAPTHVVTHSPATDVTLGPGSNTTCPAQGTCTADQPLTQGLPDQGPAAHITQAAQLAQQNVASAVHSALARLGWSTDTVTALPEHHLSAEPASHSAHGAAMQHGPNGEPATALHCPGSHILNKGFLAFYKTSKAERTPQPLLCNGSHDNPIRAKHSLDSQHHETDAGRACDQESTVTGGWPQHASAAVREQQEVHHHEDMMAMLHSQPPPPSQVDRVTAVGLASTSTCTARQLRNLLHNMNTGTLTVHDVLSSLHKPRPRHHQINIASQGT